METKYIVLKRYSTTKQDAAQQSQTINRWLNENGIIPVETVEESQHGDVPYTQRALGEIISRAEKGTVIVVSEFSRLNRDVGDSFSMFSDIRNRGIVLYAIVERMELGGTDLDMSQYMNLFMRSMSAESELKNIRNRTKMGLNAKKEELRKNGYFVSKRSGRRVEKMGNPRLNEFRDKAIKVAAERKRERCLMNVKFKQAYAVALEKKKQGKTNIEIAVFLNQLDFRTSTGKEFKSSAAISYLIQQGRKLWGELS